MSETETANITPLRPPKPKEVTGGARAVADIPKAYVGIAMSSRWEAIYESMMKLKV
jgi:hypothetical protein